MFAVAKTTGNGITVDQSGVVLDKWSPSDVVSVTIGYQLMLYARY